MGYYKAYIDDSDTIEEYGIYLKSAPYSIGGEVKDIPSNDWYDEDGEDEYIPEDGLKRKAFEITTEWAYKGKMYSANVPIKRFVKALMDRGLFTLYDSYNDITYYDVRFVKLEDDAELVRDKDGDIVIFKIVLKVNNPTGRPRV